jgi:DNA sulfur modification protein DndB
MGTIDYFLTKATFGEVARIVNYKENPKDWPQELRSQRPLNLNRVRKDMVPYLVENPEHFYNALVVEHVRPGSTNHAVKFVPDTPDSDTGWIELEGSEALEALDGQHRLKSIALAVAELPDLASETIGLVVVPHTKVAASQQLFSDLNRQAKPTPKSLNILFEHREETALLKNLASQSKYLKDRVNITSSSLSDRSPYLATIATLYEAVKIVQPVLEGTTTEERTAYLVGLWDTALAALPGVKEVVEGSANPGQLRSRYVYATGLGFEALAETIKAAVRQYPEKWDRILSQGLPRINWELKNPDWEGVALFAGRIAIARAARRRTATLVKYMLGLMTEEKTDAEHIAELENEVFAPPGKPARKLPSPVLVPSRV